MQRHKNEEPNSLSSLDIDLWLLAEGGAQNSGFLSSSTWLPKVGSVEELNVGVDSTSVPAPVLTSSPAQLMVSTPQPTWFVDLAKLHFLCDDPDCGNKKKPNPNVRDCPAVSDEDQAISMEQLLPAGAHPQPSGGSDASHLHCELLFHVSGVLVFFKKFEAKNMRIIVQICADVLLLVCVNTICVLF